jgi:hypothetical protein
MVGEVFGIGDADNLQETPFFLAGICLVKYCES